MTLTPDGLPPLREAIANHGLSARKSLGQHFLLDLNLTGCIARVSGPLEDTTVVEIGPGPGGLTRALLLEGAAQVIAIERDKRCLAALEEIAENYPDRLRIIHGDALKIDLASQITGPARVVANLPYNVGTRLLIHWLTSQQWPPWWESLTLMFQREVAERITAEPGGKAYGRLSVLAQWRSQVRRVFDVNSSAFTPPPKVVSTVVHFVPKVAPKQIDAELLERITAAAFAQRRKMLRQSLKSVLPKPEKILESVGINPARRAETVTIDEFLILTQEVARIQTYG